VDGFALSRRREGGCGDTAVQGSRCIIKTDAAPTSALTQASGRRVAGSCSRQAQRSPPLLPIGGSPHMETQGHAGLRALESADDDRKQRIQRGAARRCAARSRCDACALAAIKPARWARSHALAPRRSRHINTPREAVYRVLLDGHLVSKSKVPNGMTFLVHEFNAREHYQSESGRHIVSPWIATTKLKKTREKPSI
jgi:hypothetical protein